MKVRISIRQIIAIIISFAGVGIALGAWQNVVSPVSLVGLVGLLSGLFVAASQILQHRTSKIDNITIISFMLFSFGTLFSFLLLMINPATWKTPPNYSALLSVTSIGTILAFSFLSILNQSLKSAAFRYVNKPSSLVPFFYSTIIFSGILDWLWHGIVPQWHTVIGVGIIILGGVIMSARKLT